jgi:HK97 family phage portal protein
MPILAQVMEQRRTGATLSQLDSFLDWLVAGNTAAGIQVTEDQAMKFVGVFACVKIISESIAMLPLHLYKRRDERGKDRDRQHPLYDLFHGRPNHEMTKMEFFECGMGHLLTWGNFYAEKEKKQTGRVKALWPLRPDKMTVFRSDQNNELYYYYEQQMPRGEVIKKIFSRDQIWHLRGFSGNGLTGYNIIRQMREAIALGMALQEYGARFFSNDQRPGGVLQHPGGVGTLNDDAIKRMEKSWASAHGGLSNKHRIAILEEGVTWQAIGLPNDDSQFIESRKFQLEDLCRILRLQPHKVMHLDHATFTNIEHQSIEFVTDTVMPWLVRIEQSANYNVLSDQDRQQGYFIEHLVQGLLRGDSQQRGEFYNKRFQMGSLSPNDIRELENENPIPGGDEYFVQMNMIPLSLAKEKIQSKQEPPLNGDKTTDKDDDEGGEIDEKGAINTGEIRAKDNTIIKRRQVLAKRYHKLFLDASQRTVNRESIAVKRQVKKLLRERTVGDFKQWLDEFYTDMPGHIERNIGGVTASYMESIFALTAGELGIDDEITDEMREFMAGYVDVYITRHCDRSVGQINALIEKTEADQLVDVITQRMDEWAEKRPGKIADDEIIRQANASIHEQYRRSGVTKIRAVNTGSKSCPYCVSLDGKVIGIEETFLDQDQDFQPEGAEVPLHSRYSCKHPPFHGGCVCTIMAE